MILLFHPVFWILARWPAQPNFKWVVLSIALLTFEWRCLIRSFHFLSLKETLNDDRSTVLALLSMCVLFGLWGSIFLFICYNGQYALIKYFRPYVLRNLLVFYKKIVNSLQDCFSKQLCLLTQCTQIAPIFRFMWFYSALVKDVMSIRETAVTN